MRKDIKKLKRAIETALLNYSTENVNVMKNQENGMVDIMYCSRHDSFPIVKDVCQTFNMSESDIDKITRCYHIGYCW